MHDSQASIQFPKLSFRTFWLCICFVIIITIYSWKMIQNFILSSCLVFLSLNICIRYTINIIFSRHFAAFVDVTRFVGFKFHVAGSFGNQLMWIIFNYTDTFSSILHIYVINGIYSLFIYFFSWIRWMTWANLTYFRLSYNRKSDNKFL